MRILITGATGLIGRGLTHHLAAEGHTVSALSRDPAAAMRRLPALAEAHPWPDAPPEALAGVDAIVHLAGESVAGRWTRARRASILESRTAGTAALIAALARIPTRPRLLISASAIGYYGNRGEEMLTEDAPPGAGFLPGVCVAWEAEARRAEALGLRVATLRTGLVLAAEGGALPAMLPLYRACLGGPLGAGRQWWSWIGIRDLVALIAHLVTQEIGGPVHAVAPEPVRQRDFARALGRALRRPALLPAPAAAVRLMLGGFAEELLSSRRVVPQRALQLGFRWRHGDLDSALCDILARAD